MCYNALLHCQVPSPETQQGGRAGTSASLNPALPSLKIHIHTYAVFTKQSQLISLSSQGCRMPFQRGFVEFAAVIS